MRFDADSLNWIHLVWLVPIIGLVFLYGFHRRRQALELFARTELLRHLVASVERGRRYLRVGLVLAAAGLVALAVARPQWGSEVTEIQRRGIDLVVLLDLSRSMSAADFQVSRLERAKADLLDLVGALRGDRIGLVAFAGRAEVRCPLTFDYGFFRHILGELEIGSVSLGGTSIAQAIHKGLETFQDEYPNHKALLLITDGEDHEEFVKEAIDRARQKNVRIFAVGVGDWKEGRRIPIVDENGVTRYLQDASGKEVWTKLNPRLLQLAASETGGAYVGTGTGGFDMVELYKNYIDTMEKTDLGGYKEEKFKDRFQWFLGLGLFLLALEPLVSTRRSRLKPPPETAQERAS